ncbi:MAG: signal peptidase I [Zoogloeaceae bacterium]|jgi:signal peptidase I|nr:signal peptidase I [Zoogloeaceae bacterium]
MMIELSLLLLVLLLLAGLASLFGFTLVLFGVVLLTGVLWLLEIFWLRKRRPPEGKTPWQVEYGANLFPVLLAVFLLRSFLFEPFRIPSDSMMPTLLDGDFILVNKYTYGVRLPLMNWKIIAVNEPKRGEVMVFRYPGDTSKDYIKRVVGLPGDTVSYQDKRLAINGEILDVEKMEDYLHDKKLYYSSQFRETLGGVTHRILNESVIPAHVFDRSDFPAQENCQYNMAGVICTVPEGHYFVMGDNRDRSQDSRSWGFVPDANVVGKAFFIWFNFSDPGRIGAFQ